VGVTQRVSQQVIKVADRLLVVDVLQLVGPRVQLGFRHPNVAQVRLPEAVCPQNAIRFPFPCSVRTKPPSRVLKSPSRTMLLTPLASLRVSSDTKPVMSDTGRGSPTRRETAARMSSTSCCGTICLRRSHLARRP